MKKIFVSIFIFLILINTSIAFSGTTASYNVSSKTDMLSANASLSSSSVRTNGGQGPNGVSTTQTYNQRTGFLNYTYVDVTAPIINSTKVNLSIVYNTDGSITLLWHNDTHEDVSTYNIYRKTINITVPVNSTIKVASNINLLTWTDSSMKNSNTNYYYVLTAVDKVGNENLSAITNAVNLSTLDDCTNSYGAFGSFGSCSSGKMEHSRERTCYLNDGTTEETEEKACSSSVSAETPVISSATILSEMNPGVPSIVTIDNPSIGLYEASISVVESLQNIKITFLVVNTIPENIPSQTENEQIFKYIEINMSSNKDKVNEGNLKFKIEKSWLTQNNIDKNNVRLSRFTTKWDELSTSIINEDNDYVYFQAITPGFSYFKISGLQQKSSPAVETPSTLEKTPEIATLQNINQKSTDSKKEAATPKISSITLNKIQNNNSSFTFILLAIIISSALLFFGVKYRHSFFNQIPEEENNIHILEVFFEKAKLNGVNLELAKQRLIEQGWNKEKVSEAFNYVYNEEKNTKLIEQFFIRIKSSGVDMELAKQRLIEQGFDENVVHEALNNAFESA